MYDENIPHNREKFKDITGLLALFQGVKKIGQHKYQACCPAHGDKNPSLSITSESDKVLLHCHAGCPLDSILKALNLTPAQLFLDDRTDHRAKPEKKIVATYDYVDASGKLVFQVVRFEPKDFRQRKPDGKGGWDWQGAPDRERVLFNLSPVIEAIKADENIYIVEGEKDVLTLKSLGLTATTNAGGAGKWLPQYTETLKGADVVILPDQDEPGKAHALKVANALHGSAASTKIVNISGNKDVSAWIQAGHTKEELSTLVFDAPFWLPETTVKASMGTEKGQDPIPFLRNEEKPEPFPVDVLPDIIKNAVLEYERYGQQPLPMIVNTALATVCLVSQGYYNISRDCTHNAPMSLFFLTIGESGERKTAADEYFTAELKRWLGEKKQSAITEKKNQESKYKIWEIECNALKEKIRSGKSLNGRTIEELKEDYQALFLQEPVRIEIPELFYADINTASLGGALTTGFPLASLWTSEGMSFVGGNGMSTDNAMSLIGMINSLWDSGNYRNKRRSVESTDIVNRRLCCHLMMQGSIYATLVSGNNGLTRESGFMARFFISNPESKMGNRPYQEPVSNLPERMLFNNRVRELLEGLTIPDYTKGFQIEALTLDDEAKTEWIQYHDAIEVELRKQGEFFDVKDFASKNAENALRLAGCFHVFEGNSGKQIDKDTIIRAQRIALWFLKEVRRITGVFYKSRSEINAELMLSWFIDKGYDGKEFRPADITKILVNPLRNAELRDEAITFLEDYNFIINTSPDEKKICKRKYIFHPKAIEVHREQLS